MATSKARFIPSMQDPDQYGLHDLNAEELALLLPVYGSERPRGMFTDPDGTERHVLVPMDKADVERIMRWLAQNIGDPACAAMHASLTPAHAQ